MDDLTKEDAQELFNYLEKDVQQITHLNYLILWTSSYK